MKFTLIVPYNYSFVKESVGWKDHIELNEGQNFDIEFCDVDREGWENRKTRYLTFLYQIDDSSFMCSEGHVTPHYKEAVWTITNLQKLYYKGWMIT